MGPLSDTFCNDKAYGAGTFLYSRRSLAEYASREQRAKSKEQRDIEESVFLASFPEVDEKYYDMELEKKWDELFVLRNEVNKAFEMKRAERFIGNSLEAKVILFFLKAKAKRYRTRYKTLITQYKDFLPTFFIVSAVEIADKSLDGPL